MPAPSRRKSSNIPTSSATNPAADLLNSITSSINSSLLSSSTNSINNNDLASSITGLSSSIRGFSSSATTNNNNGVPSSASDPSSSSVPPPSELATIGIYIIGGLIAARCLAVMSRMATVLAAPAMAFYLFTTCPSTESFDGKRELKRVLRGEKLPDDDPRKPKGFLEKALAKVGASIEAEAAALAGCQVEIMDLGGIIKIATIQHPVTKTAYVWLGAMNKWRFIMAKEFPIEHTKMD